MTAPKLTVRFFRTLQDNEPVREWLKALSVAGRKAIGEEIRTVQFGWPLGMPLVRKLDVDLWEVRVRLKDRIARILFTIDASEAILLHGFIKKSQKIPDEELATAVQRKKQLKSAAKQSAPASKRN